MTHTAFEVALRAFQRRHPFAPFLVEFLSGDRVLVRHPEALRLHGAVCLHISPDRRHRLFDSTSVSQLLDVEQAPAAGAS